MKSAWGQEPRLIWSFWAAAAFVALGGAIPFLVGGSSSRIASVFIPFAVAALAFAACALIHEQGRALTSALYLLAGLAIVYGFLTMFALPLQLAVLGTCPVAPQPCPGGLQHPLTVAENTGIGAAAAFGIAALFIGFFGLVVVYRRSAPGAPSAKPPVRTIPPVTPRPAPAATPAAVEVPESQDGAGSAEAKAEAEELAEAQPEPKASVEVEALPKAKPKPKAKTKLREPLDSKPEPEAKAEVEELAEAKPEPKPSAAVETLPKAKPRPKAKTKLREPFDSKPEPKAKAEVKELTEPEPELELPAHEEAERPELPPHESTPPTT